METIKKFKKKIEENENISYVYSTNICYVFKQKNNYIKLKENKLIRENDLIFLIVMRKKLFFLYHRPQYHSNNSF